MFEYSFLDEKNYENMVHNYKSLKPIFVSDESIKFEFPKGNYFIDSIHLLIKFDGDVIPKNNLSIEDFVSEIVPHYFRTINNDPFNEKPIPSQFIRAYTDIWRQGKQKNELCFFIPLIRMTSIYENVGMGNEFTKNAYLDLIKPNNPIIDAVSIFKYMKDIDLKNLPEQIMDAVTTYAESKLEYEILYRETKFFKIGHLVPPESVDFYALNKFNVEFSGTHKNTLSFADQYEQYNYKNMLIIVDLELLNNTDNTDNTPINENNIEEIQLSTKFLSSKPKFIGQKYGDLFNNGVFKITKEHAEIFNISYQINSKYYLIDISKFIEAYVHPLTNNSHIIAHELAYDGKLGTMLSLNEKYRQKCDLYNKSVNEFIKSTEEPKIKFELELSITLQNADHGTLHVYLF
jgi:hypothetical protein